MSLSTSAANVQPVKTMISTYLKKSSLIVAGAILFGVMVALPTVIHAQNNAVSLSVTPTLFEMAANPEQVWTSNIKAINNNAYPLTVYAQVVNFAPQGETGQGKFLPVFSEVTEGATLAEWIEITDAPIVLGPGESRQVPFTVRVPKDASPGGHFAAIMIGTRPPSTSGSFAVKTSQIVTSLFFVRIAGDVVELGQVREFRTLENFYSTPDVKFEVRFENKGNVHIQPQGEIIIKNMWGKERGTIPINHKTHFGNVLPESIRKFEFSWKGELGFSDIGRYSAELLLAYGTEPRKFATSKTYFWVVPVKPVLTVFGVLVLLVLFTLWAVKSYVRRMLALEGYEPTPRRRGGSSFKREGDILIERRAKLDAPVRAGWLDLRSRLAKTQAFVDTLRALFGFVTQYRLFFGALVGAAVFIALLVYFFTVVTEESRDYEVTIENPGAEVTLSSEEILYEKQQAEQSSTDTAVVAIATSTQDFELIIVNSSDTTGQAARLQRALEPDFEVAELRSDFEESKDRSVIVYHKDLQDDALALRERLGNFILSALPPEAEERTITIYIGNDYAATE